MFKRVLAVLVVLALVCVGLVLAFRPGSVAEAQLAPEELDLRLDQDAQHYKHIEAQVSHLEKKIDDDKALFDRAADNGLSADERTEALSIYEAVLDNTILLDRIAAVHLGLFQLQGDSLRQARHFALFFAAYVEKLALGIALIDQTIGKPQFEELFDEGSQGFGIQPGAYTTLKWNVLHVEDAAKALAAHQWLRIESGDFDKIAKENPQQWGFIENRLEDRYDYVKENFTSKSVKLFGGNTIDIGKDTAHTVWFPAQTKVAKEMGHTRVSRVDDPLITEAQATEAEKQSQPGDILVERRNWFLSNVALPGFWPHAALYLGSAAELTAYFQDPDVEKAYGKPFAEYLADKYSKPWTDYTTLDKQGHTPRVLEAMSPGVIFTSAEHSIGTADYVGAMRPALTKLDKARAVERAFGYAGRPYDFDFDFYTDESLVCSELVYKAYEPREGCAGIPMSLEKVVGRMTLGPNSIVRIFDEQLGTDKERMQFAWFLDGSEEKKTAVFSTVDAFRKTHLRPKWDVVQR
ncbi:MAG TPA: YiiX/YebB-like N1pC/P60 family cysteine hydrolase [Myxococcota bacterium]|jgi:hypothetical protein